MEKTAHTPQRLDRMDLWRGGRTPLIVRTIHIFSSLIINEKRREERKEQKDSSKVKLIPIKKGRSVGFREGEFSQRPEAFS